MIIDVNQSNIQEVVVTGSLKSNVLLFIYDPNAPETATITANLECEVSKCPQGLTLAKANAQDPVILSICNQLGIASLPAICVFSQGRPVDIIQSQSLKQGNIPQLLAPYMPAPEQILFSEAQTLLNDNRIHEAYLKLEEAYKLNSKDITIHFTLIDVAVKDKKVKRARELLDAVDSANKLTSIYQDLASAVSLAEQNATNPATKLLEDELLINPDNLDNVEKLATAWSQDGEAQKALDLLYDYLKKDLNAGNIKKVYLDIVATLNGDPIQSVYRRKLYTLLY